MLAGVTMLHAFGNALPPPPNIEPREMTPQDVDCLPPNTIQIRPGTFNHFDLYRALAWCGMTDKIYGGIVGWPRNAIGERDDYNGTCYASMGEFVDGDACMAKLHAGH